jgi:hypothetical protein
LVQASNEEEGSGNEIVTITTTPVYSDDSTVRRCQELEQKLVRPFRHCCKLPPWGITNEAYDACAEELETKCNIEESCCSVPCYFKRMGIAKFIEDPYIRPNFDPGALIQMFLYFIRKSGMDAIWEPIARRSVNRCFDDLEGAVEGFYCNQTIPEIAYEVLTCSIKEQFLSCPDFSNDDQCKYNLEYMRECWVDADFNEF